MDSDQFLFFGTMPLRNKDKKGVAVRNPAEKEHWAEAFPNALQKPSVVLSCCHTLPSRDSSAIQPRRKERSSAQSAALYVPTDSYAGVWRVSLSQSHPTVNKNLYHITEYTAFLLMRASAKAPVTLVT